MGKREKGIEQLKSLIKAFADDCEGIIYHYTSTEGLKGIVENSEIWLTNTEFVNDTTECRALQEETSLFVDDDFSNECVRNQWRYFIRRPDTGNNTYIASFSRGKESLEQWRAYGSFRIGFEAEKLVKRRFNLYECVYLRDQIKDWIFRKEKVHEWNGSCLNDQAKRMAAHSLLFAASKKYKNEHYQKEKEVRLIVVSNHTWEPYPNSPSMFKDDPSIHFRDHPTYKIPVPYVKFFVEGQEEQENKQEERTRETARQMKERKLNEEKNKRRELLPIKEILIGPMLRQEEARIACEILLCEKGYENVEVNASNIPYRGF